VLFRLIFRIQRSKHITPVLISLHGCPYQNAFPSNWQLWRIDSYTAPLRPTYSRASPVWSTWHPDDRCGLLPHIA